MALVVACDSGLEASAGLLATADGRRLQAGTADPLLPRVGSIDQLLGAMRSEREDRVGCFIHQLGHGGVLDPAHNVDELHHAGGDLAVVGAAMREAPPSLRAEQQQLVLLRR
eukprot:COSAG01_NODE_3755_length_5726_cov_2.726853_4_plen_112_part_00